MNFIPKRQYTRTKEQAEAKKKENQKQKDAEVGAAKMLQKRMYTVTDNANTGSHNANPAAGRRTMVLNQRMMSS